MMKKTLVIAAVGGALLSQVASIAAADDPVPKRPEFERYSAMAKKSPFAVATAVAKPTPPLSDFGKDLYVANAAHSPDGDIVTVASSSDRNLKLYLTTAEPVDGYSISNIEWSEKVGETKVTITKDGEFATIGFNQALLSAGVAANANAAVMAQPQQLFPTPQGGQPLNAQDGNSGVIKPAPIPMLPSPAARMRPVIPRVPVREATPVPDPDEDADVAE